MKRVASCHAILVMLAIPAVAALIGCSAACAKTSAAPSDTLIVSGTVTNSHGKPLGDVHLAFFLDGRRVGPLDITTSEAGRYDEKLSVPFGALPGERVEMSAYRASYRSPGRILLQNIIRQPNGNEWDPVFIAHHSFTMEQRITAAFWIAVFVLLGVYALIAFEHLHRTLAAMLGAALMLTVSYTAGTFNPDYRILSFRDAMQAIDMNVIFLLMAMMIIVGVMKKTGVFQWMAYKSYKLARGNVFILASVLMIVTAVVSALLDNVTTMLLIIPVTIEIASTLGISPICFLIPEAFASNIGGTATLIGDPPNIMIGSYGKLTFLHFILHLGLVNIVALVLSIIYFAFFYSKDRSKTKVDNVDEMIVRLRQEYRITDKALLIKGAIVLGITILLFVMQGVLGMEPSVAALIGAAVLLVVGRQDIVEILEHEVEWTTLIFFMMLFVVVAGAEQTGLIQVIADWVKEISGGSLVVAILMVLWVSALASAIIDNIPFTATMLPIVGYLSTAIPGAGSGVLWWALSLGACLGGNGTLIGASANVVTVGMAEKAGYRISFRDYFKAAFFPMLLTIVLCSAWLLLVER